MDAEGQTLGRLAVLVSHYVRCRFCSAAALCSTTGSPQLELSVCWLLQPALLFNGVSCSFARPAGASTCRLSRRPWTWVATSLSSTLRRWARRFTPAVHAGLCHVGRLSHDETVTQLQCNTWCLSGCAGDRDGQQVQRQAVSAAHHRAAWLHEDRDLQGTAGGTCISFSELGNRMSPICIKSRLQVASNAAVMCSPPVVSSASLRLQRPSY